MTQTHESILFGYIVMGRHQIAFYESKEAAEERADAERERRRNFEEKFGTLMDIPSTFIEVKPVFCACKCRECR